MSTSENFYVTGGSLHADAPSYIERDADAALYDGLRQGEFCYVLTPRQMGKSSLMIRTAARLSEEGMHVAVLDLTALGRNLQPEQWYFGLLDRLGEQLGLEEELERFWHAHAQMGPMQRWLEAVHHVALPRFEGKLVIFVDEIDVVRSLPFSTDELFAGIRECYNRRAHDQEFDRLTFCLLGAAAPTDLVKDTRITPFNIGRRIELNDFTPEEAAPLAGGLVGGQRESGREGATATHTSTHPHFHTSTRLLNRILYWTGGHPYLTQRLCKAVADAVATVRGSPLALGNVDRLCSDMFLSSRARERDDNLLFVRDRLLKSNGDLAALLELYAKVRRGRRVPDDEADLRIGHLKISGIVRASYGRLRVRNRIYEQVFDLRWVPEHMPNAEVRRQRAAYRKGVLRTAVFAGTIVVIMAILVATSVSFARRARFNQREADRRTTQANGLARDLKVALADKVEALSQKDFAIRKVEEAVWAEKAGAEKARNAADLAHRERDHARSEKARADSAVLESRDHLVRLTVANGIQALEADDVSGALLWFIRALKMDQGNPGREAVDRIRIGTILEQTPRLLQIWSGVSNGEMSKDGRRIVTAHTDGNARVWDVATGAPVTPSMAHGPELNRALFSPDGRSVLTIGGVEARVWNSFTGRQTCRPLRHKGNINDADWSPGSRYVATGGADRMANIWYAESGKLVTSMGPHATAIECVRFGPNGSQLAVGCPNAWPILWEDVNRDGVWRPLFTAQFDPGHVRDIRFSPDGRRLATGGVQAFSVGSSGAMVWELPAGRKVVGPLHDIGVNSVDYSPNGRRLVTAGTDATAQIWDADTGKPVEPAMDLKSPASGARFCANGLYIATRSSDHGARVWNAHTSEPITPLLVNGLGAACVSLSPEGRRLFSADSLGMARLWEIGPDRSRTLPCHGTCAYFSPDGTRLIVGAVDGTAHLWDVSTWREACPPLRHGVRIVEAKFSPDGRLVATVDTNGKACVWDARTGSLLLALAHPAPVLTLTFSARGHRLATTTRHAAFIWDLATGKRLRTTYDPAGGIGAVKFSPDCQRMGAWTPDGRLCITDSYNGRTISVIHHAKQLTAGEFSPDGRRLITGSVDRTVRVWDADTGRSIGRPMRHGDDLRHACFSPDGRRVATACGKIDELVPRDARIWDASNGLPITPPLLNRCVIRHISFSPDGLLVVTSGGDGSVRVWDASTGEPVTPILKMPGQAYYAQISRGNRQVLAASNDGTVRVWDLASTQRSPEDLMAVAERMAGRRLDPKGGPSLLFPGALPSVWRRSAAQRAAGADGPTNGDTFALEARTIRFDSVPTKSGHRN